jgi:DNA helicase-2/ATP-dependent DNA helicase PcrA
MKVAMNGRDVIAFNRAASTPRRGLGDTTLELIVQLSREREISVVEAARELLESKSLPTRAIGPVSGFLDGIDKVREAATSFGPAAALRVLYDNIGLREHFLKDKEDGQSRVENIEALYAGAEAYSIEEPDVATAAFLENAALVAAADSEVETSRRVLIMTAHASKGKEFDWVYVAGVEDIYFPMTRPGTTANEFEERRLLFVACSRARKRLTLSYCEQRLRYGKVSETSISPFLDSLPVSVSRIITPSRQHGVRQGQSIRGQQRPWNSKEFSVNPPRGVQPTKPARRNVGNRLTPSQVSTGVRVMHSTFGEGTVVCLHEGSDPTVEINFSAGSRTLALSLAPLELL